MSPLQPTYYRWSMSVMADSGSHFAHFATREAQAPDLWVILWDAVDKLQEWGFAVSLTLNLNMDVYTYCCTIFNNI